MIVDFLLSVAVSVIGPLLSVFSFSTPTPAPTLAGFAVVGSDLAAANRYLPVGLFLTLIVAGFVFDLSLTGAKGLVWLYEHLPFKAT